MPEKVVTLESPVSWRGGSGSNTTSKGSDMTFPRIAFAALLFSSALLPVSADARGGGGGHGGHGGHGGRGGFSSGGHHGWSSPRMTYRPAPAMTRGAHYAPGYRPTQMRSGAQWHSGGFAQRRAGMMLSHPSYRMHAAQAWAGSRGHGYRHAHPRFAAAAAARQAIGFRSLRRQALYAAPLYAYDYEQTVPYDYGYADSYEGGFDTSYYGDSGYRPGFLAFLAGGGGLSSRAYAAPVQQDYSLYSYRPRCACY
jgi:hypothetical protein